jgi:hypothetical protein
LFLGASGGGKTTLALTAARDGGYLVSGDQSEVLAGERAGPLAVGFPWPVRIGAGTLRGLGLTRFVETANLQRPQAAITDGRLTSAAYQYRSVSKAELTAIELSALLGVECVDVARIETLVVLVPSSSSRVRVERTELADVRDTVLAEYREPDPAHESFWLSARDDQPPGARPFETFAEAMAPVPVYRLAWSPDRYSAQDALTEVRALSSMNTAQLISK